MNLEIYPEKDYYKLYVYNSELCQKLNRMLKKPYGSVNFLETKSEGIFKVPKSLWPKVLRLINVFKT